MPCTSRAQLLLLLQCVTLHIGYDLAVLAYQPRARPNYINIPHHSQVVLPTSDGIESSTASGFNLTSSRCNRCKSLTQSKSGSAGALLPSELHAIQEERLEAVQQQRRRQLLQASSPALNPRYQPPYNVCVSEWTPVAICTPGGPQENFTGWFFPAVSAGCRATTNRLVTIENSCCCWLSINIAYM